MDILAVMLLALAVSFDSLAIGVSYGVNQIAIPSIPRIILSAISALVLLGAMVIGNLLSQFLTPQISNILGGVVLVLLGAYNIWRGFHQPTSTQSHVAQLHEPYVLFKLKLPSLGLIINVIKQPLAADYDQSKIISLQEAVFLGIALALDSFAAGIGAAILKFPIIITVLAVMVTNFAFLSQGLSSGRKLANRISSLPLQWIPGLIIIAIGVVKLFIF